MSSVRRQWPAQERQRRSDHRKSGERRAAGGRFVITVNDPGTQQTGSRRMRLTARHCGSQDGGDVDAARNAEAAAVEADEGVTATAVALVSKNEWANHAESGEEQDRSADR